MGNICVMMGGICRWQPAELGGCSRSRLQRARDDPIHMCGGARNTVIGHHCMRCYVLTLPESTLLPKFLVTSSTRSVTWFLSK